MWVIQITNGPSVADPADQIGISFINSETKRWIQIGTGPWTCKEWLRSLFHPSSWPFAYEHLKNRLLIKRARKYAAYYIMEHNRITGGKDV